MFKDKRELTTALLTRSPDEFVSHYIFEPVPFVFDNNLTSWIRWKSILGTAIDVDPYAIVLTGSAAVGYSLNPNKNYKTFDDQSDVDCGVISEHHFDIAWRYLRRSNTDLSPKSNELTNAIKDHRRYLIFSGTIGAEKILPVLPFGIIWNVALESMSKVSPTSGRDVKVRIYKDYDSLRHYHAKNIKHLRDKLLIYDDSV